jgi:hypothetical protein
MAAMRSLINDGDYPSDTRKPVGSSRLMTWMEAVPQSVRPPPVVPPAVSMERPTHVVPSTAACVAAPAAVAPASPEPIPTSEAPRVHQRRFGAKLAFNSVPEYVQLGAAVCDGCDKPNLRFGFHAEPNLDLCLDCFHFVHNTGTVGPGAQEARALRTKLDIRVGKTAFVEFAPLF